MKFNAYEYIGVIVPGSILIVTATALYPDILPVMKNSLSVGDLGLTLILAFICGHLLQALGNLWESIVWAFFGGMPSTWVAKPCSSLLSDAQLIRLDEKLTADFQVSRTDLKSGRGSIREIMVHVGQRGRLDRIEMFNRNYGLMRGVASGFMAAGILVLVADPSNFSTALGLFGLVGVATYRMIRFAIHYAREAFTEYLSLPALSKADATTP